MNKENLKQNIKKSQLKIDKNIFYSLEKAIELIKNISHVKFDSTIDLIFNLNLNVKKNEQQLKGSLPLPFGSGKKIIILAIVDNLNNEKLAKEAKADFVVYKEDMIQIFNKKKFDFDIIVTEPKLMPQIAKFGKILGPKGLMPSLKKGTITNDFLKIIKEIKKGKFNFKTDKNGIIHTVIGKNSMDSNHLIENAKFVISNIYKLKPSNIKGKYVKNIMISSTMGPSIKLELNK